MTRLFIFSLLFLFLSSCDLLPTSEDEDLKIVYFPDSKIIKQSVEYEDGKKNGLLLAYYRNGNPKAVQHYRNDTLTDTSFFYYDNGVLSNYQIFKNNRRIGCWKKFNKTGKEYSTMCFKNGLMDGVSTEYSYKSIRLIKRYNYKENVQEGKQELFYNSGKPKSVTWFFNGYKCLGTEEWTEDGKKIDNDFKISVTEKNEVLMKNKLTFIITLENPKPDDQVYYTGAKDTGRVVTTVAKIYKDGNRFLIEYNVARGGFVMEEVELAAFRITSFGNMHIKKTKFMASANNF